MKVTPEQQRILYKLNWKVCFVWLVVIATVSCFWFNVGYIVAYLWSK